MKTQGHIGKAQQSLRGNDGQISLLLALFLLATVGGLIAVGTQRLGAAAKLFRRADEKRSIDAAIQAAVAATQGLFNFGVDSSGSNYCPASLDRCPFLAPDHYFIGNAKMMLTHAFPSQSRFSYDATNQTLSVRVAKDGRLSPHDREQLYGHDHDPLDYLDVNIKFGRFSRGQRPETPFRIYSVEGKAWVDGDARKYRVSFVVPWRGPACKVNLSVPAGWVLGDPVNWELQVSRAARLARVFSLDSAGYFRPNDDYFSPWTDVSEAGDALLNLDRPVLTGQYTPELADFPFQLAGQIVTITRDSAIFSYNSYCAGTRISSPAVLGDMAAPAVAGPTPTPTSTPPAWSCSVSVSPTTIHPTGTVSVTFSTTVPIGNVAGKGIVDPSLTYQPAPGSGSTTFTFAPPHANLNANIISGRVRTTLGTDIACDASYIVLSPPSCSEISRGRDELGREFTDDPTAAGYGWDLTTGSCCFKRTYSSGDVERVCL